jgi:hypothetical protein
MSSGRRYAALRLSDVTAPAPAARYRDLLAVRQMRAVLLAHVISMVGSVVAEVALSVLVYARTGSSLLSAATLALGFLPYVLGGTVLSGLADRYPVRRLLVTCDLLSATVVALMLLPGLPVAALLGLVVLLGTVPPVFGAARSADLAGALPGGLWLLARSALRVLAQTTLVTGFAVGGLLLTIVGPRQFAANRRGVVPALRPAAARWNTGPPGSYAARPGQAPSAAAEARRAVQLLSSRPRLRRLLLLGWLPWTFASGADGLAVTYSVGVGGGAAGASLLLCALAGGTVLGELLASRLPVAIRPRLVVPLALAMLVPLLGFAVSPGLPAAVALLFLVGLGACYAQGLDALVLAEMDLVERGRVLAVQGSGLMVLQGLGILGGGALAEVLPAGPALALGAACELVLVAHTAAGLRA